MKEKYIHLKGKRLAALDYGRKRVGFAVCDEFHITTSPRGIFDITSDNFWTDLLNSLDNENISAIVVGMPYRHDDTESEMMTEIGGFIVELKKRTDMDVYEYDEAYSTHRAIDTMLKIGYKKKKRAQKGRKDEIAAALILKDFLEFIDNNH